MDEEPATNESDYPDQAPPIQDIKPINMPEPAKVIEPTHNFEPDPVPVLESVPASASDNVNYRPDATQVTPATAQPQPAVESSPEKPSPGMIVLQWMTYALWGWTVLAMSILVVIVLTSYLVPNSNVGDSPVYSMAALLVLLPMAVICDKFYMKHEHEKKTGAAAVVMIIHAVIFALFGIGALIVIVFQLVTMFVSASSSELTQVMLYGAIIITILYALVFLRTVLPKSMFKLRVPFLILMLSIVGVICAFGIFGPIMAARETRNDVLIENNLSTISSDIESYANKNNYLPTSLNSLPLIGDAKKLVTDNLVAYKKDSTPYGADTEYQAYYYQLCVNYKKASKNQDTYTSYSRAEKDGYSEHLSTYSHGAGDVCYKLKAVNYDSSGPAPMSGLN